MASLSSMWSRFQRKALFEHASSFSSRDGTPPLLAIRPVMNDGNRQQIVLEWPVATLSLLPGTEIFGTPLRPQYQELTPIIFISSFVFQLSVIVLNSDIALPTEKMTANQTLYVKFKVGRFIGFDKRWPSAIICYHQESDALHEVLSFFFLLMHSQRNTFQAMAVNISGKLQDIFFLSSSFQSMSTDLTAYSSKL